MADQLYISEHDGDVLREMAKWFRASVNNPRGRPAPQLELGAPGDVIALIPAGGIAARSGATVSSADCTLYRILDGELLELDGQTQTVYNLSAAAVAAGTYCPVIRDRFGAWLASLPGGYTGTRTIVEGVQCVNGVITVTTHDYEFSNGLLISVS